MRGDSESEAVIARLSQEHLNAPFPARLRGADVAGNCMVFLDANIAGCVSTWLDSDDPSTHGANASCAACISQLEEVLPLLTDAEELQYYERLNQLALLIN